MGVASAGIGSGALEPGRADDFRGYLERLLTLPSFAARRRGQLLRYLVDQKLAGHADQLTEYGIALDVFEKPTAFDPRSEATVRVEMSRLRRALAEHYEGAGAADPWRIQLPGRGYVPIIQVYQPPAGENAEAIYPSTRTRVKWLKRIGTVAAVLAVAVLGAILVARYWHPWNSSIHSVVVLPFENLTGDVRNDYLADGVTEQLTDALAQMPSLRVVARTSAFQFKGKAGDIRDIGRRVDADAVVEGSLRYLNGKLRLTVQVNRSTDGYHILSRTFDGAMQELGRLENEMVPPVVAALRPGSAVANRRTPDPQAYDLLLKSNAIRAKGTLEAHDQAIIYLTQAIEHDPQYADAYAALGSVYVAGAVNDLTPEPLESAKKAKAAAAIAIGLDPACSRAYAVQGFVDSLILLDWNKGEQELRKAVALMPQNATNHNWLGLVLLARGRFAEAVAEQRTAENLDPLIAGVGTPLAYYVARRYDDALRQYFKVRDMHPEVIAIHPLIGDVWREKREFSKAMAEYQLALPKIPYLVEGRIALLLASMGQQAEARKILAGLEHPKADDPPPDAFDIAAIYAALGDRDTAFRWLDRAYERRMVWFLKVQPALDPLRGDPRYAELLKKTGLAD